MRISDWSSDVCSSDLVHSHRDRRGAVRGVVPGVLQGLSPHPTSPGAPVSGLLQRAIALMVIATKGVPPMRILAGLMTILLTSLRSEEHTSELQSLMRISYAVFSLKKKNTKVQNTHNHQR